MTILGLTGSSGSGKSTVSSIFAEFGAYILDADEIYANLLLNCDKMKLEISNSFDVLTDNQIDREKLGSIVFTNKDKLETLNKITHKYVSDFILNEIENVHLENIDVLILDVPLLFESNLDRYCDKILGVVSDDDVKLDRICKRDEISKEHAINRLKSQKDNCFFSKNCDIIIENNFDFAMLKLICKRIYKTIGE